MSIGKPVLTCRKSSQVDPSFSELLSTTVVPTWNDAEYDCSLNMNGSGVVCYGLDDRDGYTVP